MEVEPIFELGYLSVSVDLSSSRKPTLSCAFHSQAAQPTDDTFVLNLKTGVLG